MHRVLIILYLLTTCLVAAQELGTYLDENGRLHITNKPKNGWVKVNPDGTPIREAVRKPDAFTVRLVPAATPYAGLINEAAEKYGIDGFLIKAVITVESSFNPKAVSTADAKGLMQLMDPTAAMLGVTDSFNPRQNVMAGSRYLRNLLTLYEGDLRLALAAYNAGQGAVRRHGGIPPYKETIRYLQKVAHHYNTLDYHISEAELSGSMVVARALAKGRTVIYRYETANGYALSEVPPGDRAYVQISIVD